MLPIVDFFMKNIYCASKQDSQYSFSLVKVNAKPVKGSVSVYNITKRLPDMTVQYDVYVLGNLSPTFLNMLKQGHEWFRDVWVNVADDMKTRDYILHAYDHNGVMHVRSKVFYSFIDESSLIFCVQRDMGMTQSLLDSQALTIHVYSNAYFNTPGYRTLPVCIGIDYDYRVVYNNVDKVALQQWITSRESTGGKCFIYINGLFYDKLTLDIANGSAVEVVYDQSVVSKTYVPISSLRQFTSTKFGGTRYLLVREKVLPEIEYYDDSEVYVATSDVANNRGVFYFRHSASSMFMGTDKDYTFNSAYVNTMANYLSTVTGGAVQDKQLVLYTRRGGAPRPLVYSDLRLHEFYKLPLSTQLNTLDGSGDSITELRVESTENSLYFNIAAINNPFAVTKEMFMQAIGYNAVSYYYGYNLVQRGVTLTVDVPELYQEPSTVYEYDSTGKMLGHRTTVGPLYVCSSSSVTNVEFIKGLTPVVYKEYYANQVDIALSYSDYVVASALFSDNTRMTEWEDITYSEDKVYRSTGDILSVNETANKRVAVVYLNEPNLYDIDLDITQGAMHLPLTQHRYINGSAVSIPLDIAYTNVELFLNGYRLVEGVDYFMAYPWVSICNKSYLDYTLPKQKLHVRCHGFTLDKSAINALEIKGWVNNGVLGRNNVHDIRDDRVMGVYVAGKLYPRASVRYAEEDHTVRLNDALNGRPYVMTEPMISVKQVTGLDTLAWYTAAKAKDQRMRDFFSRVMPEPVINDFNVIGQRHVLYSPVISKILVDVLEGVIPESVYTTAYDDGVVIALLDANYSALLAMDPVKKGLPASLVEIQPHVGNTVINVNLYQYRFMTNVVRILSRGQVNLSGYLSVSA